jgi:hypothetical protein
MDMVEPYTEWPASSIALAGGPQRNALACSPECMVMGLKESISQITAPFYVGSAEATHGMYWALSL